MAPPEASLPRCTLESLTLGAGRTRAAWRWPDGDPLGFVVAGLGYLDVSVRAAHLAEVALRDATAATTPAALLHDVEARLRDANAGQPDPDLRGALTAIAARHTAEGLTIAWAGDCCAFLVRDRRIVAETLPDTLRHHLPSEQAARAPEHVLDVSWRALGNPTPTDLGGARWALEPFDTVVLADHAARVRIAATDWGDLRRALGAALVDPQTRDVAGLALRLG